MMLKQLTPNREINTVSIDCASIFLCLLLCGDLVFIVLHFISSFTANLNLLLNLSQDRGYSEIYQYLKFIWIIFLLITIVFKKKSKLYLAWMLVFTYFLFDDALQIHERFGSYIASNYGITSQFGLRPQDFGELAVSAFASLLLVPILIWAYRQGSLIFRKTSQDIALLIFILGVFGIFIDMVHILFISNWSINFILGTIEDGGEMLVVSLIVWYVFLKAVKDDEAIYSLCDVAKAKLKNAHWFHKFKLTAEQRVR